MTIAVCLITADRPDYTRRTLDSFRRHVLQQPCPEPLLLLHGDDASTSIAADAAINDCGFETVFVSERRIGGHATRRAVVDAAARRGAARVLMMENDWEWMRPMPWGLYEHAFSMPDVDCLRLYGRFKEWGGARPCDTRDAGSGREVEWKALTKWPAEVGHIHWAAPPSIARTELVQRVLQDTDKPGQARRLSSTLFRRTVRPETNVVCHIGVERTPGFTE